MSIAPEFIGGSIACFVGAVVFLIFAVGMWVDVGKNPGVGHKLVGALAWSFMAVGAIVAGAMFLIEIPELAGGIGGGLFGVGFVLGLVAVNMARRGG